jgi:hypothetical protein
MVGDNRNKWTQPQCDLLEKLVEAGVGFNVISERTGHPISSCRTKASELRSMRREAEAEKFRKNLKPAPAAPVPSKPRQPIIAQAAPSPSPSRAVKTSTLVADAEIRARIAIQGPNGLLGDPLPGRSALDQRKAGAC